MTIPKVSVCVPAYRQTNYLKIALDSLMSQRFSDYELIITDDSETNEVEKLVATYDFADRLTYVRNAVRLGSPGNWNACMALARGKYTKILHHDDWFTNPDSLGSFVALLDQQPDASFGFCASRVFSKEGYLLWEHRASQKDLDSLRRQPEVLFLANMVGAPSATIYRSERALEFDERLKWLVDVEQYIRVLRSNPEFAFSPEALICTPTGISHQVTQDCYADLDVQLREHVLVFDKHYGNVSQLRQLAKFWRYFFLRHRIWTLWKLRSLVVCPPAPDAYFSKLFRFPMWLWMIWLLPYKSLVACYARLPEPAKTKWRALKQNFIARKAWLARLVSH